MNEANAPGKLTLPFAASGGKNIIPVASQIGVTPGAASFADGFPPLTMTPLAAGGTPPSGLDMNGILNMISSLSHWFSAGAGFPYDSTFANDPNVGGYPKGAKVLRMSGYGYWLNTVDGNTSNPDTGGAGWIGLNAGSLLNIQIFTANGIYTPTAGTESIIVEGVGAGGVGGGTNATLANQYAVSAGGCSGAHGVGRFTSGFSGGVAVTIGAPNLYAPGGATSLGTMFICPGGFGAGGNRAPTDAGTPLIYIPSSQYISLTGANLKANLGSSGSAGFFFGAQAIMSGAGGDSPFGPGGTSVGPVAAVGYNGNGFGSGGGGVAAGPSAAMKSGGNGAPGILIIYEYA